MVNAELDSLLARFRHVVSLHGDDLAILGRANALTYRELDQLSSTIACTLNSLSVAAGSRVALLGDRSVDAVVAILGILRAGAAYVPLDSRLPADRLRYMVERAHCSIALCDAKNIDAAGQLGLKGIGFAEAQTPRATCALPTPHAASAAYVMFTSGTTGAPKGVEIPHVAIPRLVLDAGYVDLGPGVRVLHAAPLGFDAATFEIWGPLLNGGVCVVFEDDFATPTSIGDTIRRHHVDTAWLTSALFNTVVDEDVSALGGLKELIIGGEALSVSHVRRAQEALPGLSLVNGYGPTECTTFSTAFRIPRPVPLSWSSIPIGMPIRDTSAWVLGDSLEPVDGGHEGELCIGGTGLSLGYLEDPALSAARFVTVALPVVGPTRLYRTGDRVQRAPDGNLIYLGRTDQQVKLRGFRIELGEVEAALKALPNILDAACIVREDKPGDRRLVAYVVADHAGAIEPTTISDALRPKLPDFMLPSSVVRLERLPVNANGKLDRPALPAPSRQRPELRNAFEAPQSRDEQVACSVFESTLSLDTVGRRDNFFELGGNSLLAVRAVTSLQRSFSKPVSIVDFFRDPTPAALAECVARALNTEEPDSRPDEGRKAIPSNDPIAIVGWAGRFPHAQDVEEFWRVLCAGQEAVTWFDRSEIDSSVDRGVATSSEYVPARGVLRDVAGFDAAFFGFSPLEATLTDPQQRLFLEISWEALEHAGHDPAQYQGSVGVFGGMYNATYFQRHLVARPDLISDLGEFQVMLANEKDYLATRVSHRLDLSGPSLSINTACSTSLVAVCEAAAHLRARQCDMAIAGGVAVTCPPNSGYLYQEGSMLSPDGHTRPFSSDAAGTVFSDGAAVVVLKRLSDATRDRDTVYGLLLGEAVNNDGARKASFTAPSPDAQARVISSALIRAGIDARSIGYVEAHGTATPIGDPIELHGLSSAYRAYTADNQYCAIGSLKGNFGHMVTAAGAAGLIKATLALNRGVIPPSINFRDANPALQLESSPFSVPTVLTPWPRTDGTRRAGVSSFGVGGTNAHVIVQEPPPAPSRQVESGPFLIPLSARSWRAVASQAERLAAALSDSNSPELRDVAYTMQRGRRPFAHRTTIVAQSTVDAVEQLRGVSTKIGDSSAPGPLPTAVVFMFPGQGAQYAGMGRELCERSTVFRAALDAATSACGPVDSRDLRSVMFASDAEGLLPTSITQPALFCFEYALATFWISLGIRPAALVGHSVGEFVAAVIAGTLSLEDGARLVVQRGRIMQAQPAGSMLAVRAEAARIAGLLPAHLSLAADNAPTACVVAGDSEAIVKFQEELERTGILSKVLATSHAFHSSMMEAAAVEFEAVCLPVRFTAPSIRIASTATGGWLTEREATSPAYWARHLRETVRFAEALGAALTDGNPLLVEVGPGTALASFARQQIASRGGTAGRVIPGTGGSSSNEWSQTLRSIGRAWETGQAVSWDAVSPHTSGQRVGLPSYPFERQRYWVDAPAAGFAASAAGVASDFPPAATAETPAPPQISQAGHASGGTDSAQLETRLRQLVAQVTGADMSAVPMDTAFNELGLDSLVLTQVAMRAQREWGIKISFRELTETFTSMELVAGHLLAELARKSGVAASKPAVGEARSAVDSKARPAATPMQTYDVKKAFGAIARIHTNTTVITPKQRDRLSRFVAEYTQRTRSSKDYTQSKRARLADPRVVNGFRPLLKEIVYQIVIGNSKGAHVVDLDGNEYVDILNGFGMNLFGWRPDFVNDAVMRQLSTGYEIGPQHPLAGDVADLVCEMTQFDRAGLCNTGSEAVMGAIRIARTVTGRGKIALFTGSYHGIFDEVIVRATSGSQAYPAAPGIMPNTAENVIVLDYGTPESLAILEANADDLAAVLVEPVQSRRPDFQPREYMHQLREFTSRVGSLLIFDEVVTGFRSHPRGAQEIFGVDADIATYGKVVGGGFPIGIIAGKREFMDALDGGHWQFGDESRPTAGVTYFAGTFVRHPLALAAAKAVLEHLKTEGPALQHRLNEQTTRLADQLNDLFAETGAPMAVKHFSSVWRITFTEEHPLGDLVFAMLRHRGIHVLDNFPCFMTTAHTNGEVALIVEAFRDSIAAMQASDFFPAHRGALKADTASPPVPGARLGKDPQGNPAWFIPDPSKPGRYLRLH